MLRKDSGRKKPQTVRPRSIHRVGNIRPHRSYRRLSDQAPPGLTLNVVILAVAYFVFLQMLDTITQWFSIITIEILPDRMVDQIGSIELFGTVMYPIYYTPATLRPEQLIIYAIIGFVVLFFVRKLKFIVAPLRILFVYNLCLTLAAIVYLLLQHNVGFQASTLSEQMLRLTVMNWILLPPIISVICLIFPFNILERVAVVYLAVAYGFLFSLARYALFLVSAASIGHIFVANFFLFFGPTFDVLFFVSTISWFVPRLSRRFDDQSDKVTTWRWS